MAATQKQIFPLLAKKKSQSYKSKHFARVFDLRDSKSDVCLTVALTGNAILGKSNMAACKNRILHNFDTFDTFSPTF